MWELTEEGSVSGCLLVEVVNVWRDTPTVRHRERRVFGRAFLPGVGQGAKVPEAESFSSIFIQKRLKVKYLKRKPVFGPWAAAVRSAHTCIRH